MLFEVLLEVLVKVAHFCQIDGCIQFGALMQVLFFGVVLFEVLVTLWTQFLEIAGGC